MANEYYVEARNKKYVYSMPGSKSVTNRLIFINGLMVTEKVILINPLLSQDTLTMVYALNKLGRYIIVCNNLVMIDKKCKEKEESKVNINVNNSGTVTRPLISFLMVTELNRVVKISCHKRMESRPIIGLLHKVMDVFYGCNRVKYVKKIGHLPVCIYPNKSIKKRGVLSSKIIINGAISSQYITAILMVIPLILSSEVCIILKNIVSYLYITMTIMVMEKCGINIKVNGDKIIIGKGRYRTTNKTIVEGDYTPLGMFIVNAMIRNKSVVVKNIYNSELQGDKCVINVTKMFRFKGYHIRDAIILMKSRKQYVRKSLAICVDIKNIPDAAMAMWSITFSNVRVIKMVNTITWQYKECNRLYAVSKETKKFGCKIVKGKNWIIILRSKRVCKHGIKVSTYEDHRIGMCYSLGISESVVVSEPNVVKKTYPNFYRDLKSYKFY